MENIQGGEFGGRTDERMEDNWFSKGLISCIGITRGYEALQDIVYIWRPQQVCFGMLQNSLKIGQMGYFHSQLDT
jgi:hypothetical protein